MTTSVNAGPAARALAHWLRGPSAWLAFAVPLLVGLGRLSPASQWRDDVAIVRGLGFLPIGGEGVVSAVLVQLATLLPVGGRLLRAAVPSALLAALASYLIFCFTLRLLDRNAPAPRLSPLMALLAAWAVVLGPVWQRESTVTGGASVAAALVLLAAAVRLRLRLDARGWLAFGAVTGLACLENRFAGLACLSLLVVDMAMLRQLPRARELLLLVGGIALLLAFGLLPFLARPVSGGVWTDFGTELARLDGGSAAWPVVQTVEAWVESSGLMVVIAGALGAAWALLRPRTRPWLVPFLGFLLLDLALPHGPDDALSTSPTAPVRLLAVAVLVSSAAVAVHTFGLALSRANVPLARPAQALLVVSSLTFVLIVVEESQQACAADARRAAESWTDEALGSLPPRSLLMVRSEPAAWRLWAARVSRGERPDLTVVPLPLLDSGDTSVRLLELEPHLAPLIRELRVSGRPSEFALSSLADARPLYLEFDPKWDHRLLEHVLPHPFWLRFAPHALGRSDRREALEASRGAFSRVLRAATEPVPDSATLSMLTSSAREQVVLLATLGDRESVRRLLEELSSLPEEGAFVRAMHAQLESRAKVVDWMAHLQ